MLMQILKRPPSALSKGFPLPWRALRAVRGLAERIVHQAPDALLLVDAGGHIVYVNEAATTLFGYAAAELLGQTIEALVPDSSRGVHERYCGRVLRRRRPPGRWAPGSWR